eukprot:m.67765 g.67765  ORF g.67765 m.67765 type:complete len:204 (+) comp35468_c0_seq25:387-998(+)
MPVYWTFRVVKFALWSRLLHSYTSTHLSLFTMDESPNGEEAPLISDVWKEKGIQDHEDDNGETRVYYRRFYVVLIVFFMGFTQALIWNSWGPIQGPAEAVFHWSDATIALMANWGPIAYIISTFFFTWLMGKSIRASVVLTTFLIAAGAALRVCSMESAAATWLNHVGLFLNAKNYSHSSDIISCLLRAVFLVRHWTSSRARS